MPRRPRRYLIDPDVSSIRTILNPQRGFFSVVIPLARTNLVTNPSAETGITGGTTRGTMPDSGRTTAQSYHGAYSFYGTPSTANTAAAMTGGIGWGSLTIGSGGYAAGTTYAVSCKFKGQAGVPYQFYVENSTGPVAMTAKQFIATGRWQWLWLFHAEASGATGTRNLIIAKNNSRDGNTFYWDGLQVEALTDGILAPTTYIDGDQAGLLANQYPPPYRWSGTAHASTSSRDVTTRAGGYVLNLDRFSFRVLAYAGLGLAVLSNIALAGAATDGAAYQTSVVQSRQFAVRGVFDATTPANLQRLRSDLYGAVGPDAATPRQPLTLLYQAFDCDRESGSMGRIIASYQSGLEQNASAIPREDATITFTQWLPAILANESGVALTVQQTVTNANDILQRAANGTWSALGTGLNGAVNSMALAPDGSIYVAGAFTTAGGVTVNGIAKWTPSTSTWSALGTGLSGGTATGYGLAIAPDGALYLGGSFTAAGGVAAANIAKWNGSVWSALGAGANNIVGSLVFGVTGTLYAGGSFTSMAAVANTIGIASWNGAAWASVGGGVNTAPVQGLAIGLDGALYATGAFTLAGGIANTVGVAKWDGTAWTALGTGTGITSGPVAVGPDGAIYVGGNFTTAGGISANRIARWNGSSWAPLGTGMNATVYALTFRADGALIATGVFTTAGGVALPDGMALWNGSAWVALDVDLPGSALIVAALAPNANTIYVGFNQTGSATAAGLTTVTPNGTARAYPTITITGPSSGTARIYQLLNATTGKLIYLNLTMNAGETVILRTSNKGATLTSSFRGDVSSAILPGSSPDFALEKGANSISFFSAGSSVTALMIYANAYATADDLTE
jgi:hypothetical protein